MPSLWRGPRCDHRRNHRTQEPTLTLTLTARRNFVTNKEEYDRLVTEFHVVVEGENVDVVEGKDGSWRKSGEVVFFFERGLRSKKTLAEFQKLPEEERDVEEWRKHREGVGTVEEWRHWGGVGTPEEWQKRERGRCRTFKPLSDFQGAKEVFEEKLRGLGLEGAEAEISEPELIAARLYTGPMFVKYNGILRGMGDVRDATQKEVNGNQEWVLKRDIDAVERIKRDIDAGKRDPSKELKLKKMSDRNINALEQLTSPLPLPRLPGEDAKLVHRGEALKVFDDGKRLDFKGNLYPTTIHTLDGMLRKLAKVTECMPLYRGCGGGARLPPQLEYPDKFRSMGGCEISNPSPKP